MSASYKKSLSTVFFIVVCAGISGYAQTGGHSTSITGTVLDPSGAVVPNATVEIHNPVSALDRSTTPVSALDRSTTTDSSGKFSIPNIPFNPYHLSVTAAGSPG